MRDTTTYMRRFPEDPQTRVIVHGLRCAGQLVPVHYDRHSKIDFMQYLFKKHGQGLSNKLPQKYCPDCREFL